VIGCRDTFWSLGEGGPAKPPGGGEVAISETLAHELGVSVGDQILLRVPAIDALPTESLLGEIDDTMLSRRFRVAAVLANAGIARFGLQPSQHPPRNVFLSLAALQNLLDQPGEANVLLVAGDDVDTPSSEVASGALQAALRPDLDDYGLKVEFVEST
jgi:ABC-type lipoprotein release transport system permease subunit